MPLDLDALKLKRDLTRFKKPKNDIEAVIRFMVHQDVQLSPQQDRLLNRLIYADGLMKKREKSSEEIIQDIMQRFDVTHYRAQQDVYDCQHVFGEARKMNRAYLLSHHIEEVGMMIKKVMGKEKLWKLLPKLFDSYTYAINALPTEATGTERPPAILMFNFNGKPPVDQQPVEDVIAEADALLKPKPHGEFIEFEEDNPAEHAPDAGGDSAGE